MTAAPSIPKPSAPAGPWRDVTRRYWGGPTSYAAHEATFGTLALLVIRDASGWCCKCLGLFGETRMEQATEGKAKAWAIGLLTARLEKALKAVKEQSRETCHAN
jgi:hypothetical protein